MRSKGMQLGAMLATMLLVSMAFVPGVIAQPPDGKDTVVINKEVKENIDLKYANGKGDGQLLTNSPTGGDVTILGTKEWSANTDLYNYYPIELAPRLNTYSRSRDSGSPWDIDEIGVRGRAWRDNNIIFDQTVTNFNSADASIYWKSGCSFYCGGSYYARGDHTFEEQGYYSWYPVTEDTLNV